MTRLDDIARALGVSKSTVSKALNGAEDVSDATRRAVTDKAVELGYARTGRLKQARRVVVFILNMEYHTPDDFGYDVLLGFRKAAEPAGFEVEVIALDPALQDRISYDTYMMMEHYCGALFLGISPTDPWIREFETCKTPTVLYDNHISGNPHVTHVGVDNLEGMEMAVGYLRSLGHTTIGYLSAALESYIYRWRYHAFRMALEENGLQADPALAGSAYHISDCLSQHLPRLLENGCTAIVCSHDLLASSVMVHCMELGLNVPRDISILGFDDIPLCRYTAPPLTTIRQDRQQLGASAFLALQSQLQNMPMGTLLLHPQLICRSSCSEAPRPSRPESSESL